MPFPLVAKIISVSVINAHHPQGIPFLIKIWIKIVKLLNLQTRYL